MLFLYDGDFFFNLFLTIPKSKPVESRLEKKKKVKGPLYVNESVFVRHGRSKRPDRMKTRIETHTFYNKSTHRRKTSRRNRDRRCSLVEKARDGNMSGLDYHQHQHQATNENSDSLPSSLQMTNDPYGSKMTTWRIINSIFQKSSAFVGHFI